MISFIFIACLRVASTVALANQTDVVYELAALSFWGSSEILLVLLIFCVPAFQKAFKRSNKDKGNRSSGLEKSQSDSLWESSGTPWPRSTLLTMPQSVYRHIDEHSLEYLTQSRHSGDRSVVTSSPLESVKYTTLSYKAGIIRTPEFETSEHYAPSNANEEHLHQYPWTQNHSS